MEFISSRLAEINWKRCIQFNVAFMSEVILLLICLFPLFLMTHKGGIVYSILASVFFAVLLSSLFMKESPRTYLTMGIIILFSLIGGIPWWLIGILLVFVQIRIHAVFEKIQYEAVSSRTASSAIFIGLFMYFFAKAYDPASQSIIISVLLLQLFVFTYGAFISQVVRGSSVPGKRKMVAMISLGYIVLLLISFALVLLISPYLHNSLNFLLKGVIYLLGYIFGPIMEWLRTRMIERENSQHDTTNTMKFKEIEEQKQLHGQGAEKTPEWLDDVLILLFILIIGSILYYFRKRKFNFAEAEDETANAVVKSTKRREIEGKDYGQNAYLYSKGDNKVRDLVEELEKLAVKKGMSRKAWETIGEWMSNQKISCDEPFIKIYEMVRYGNRKISEDELLEFEKKIKDVKKQMESREVPKNNFKKMS
ncbi:hypothetical protein [Falsibacillus pallidus]|uniref:hypothetical protein n=1 Tax=Falsibacillus pallidus TaxID=493781 RepID=UPI003D95BC83